MPGDTLYFKQCLNWYTKMSYVYALLVGLTITMWSQDLIELGAFATRPNRRFYPSKSLFMVTDFFVGGCKTFLEKCPRAYKVQPVCARSHSGQYKEFVNYCEMEYENCNTWNNYHMYKREKC